MTEPTRARFYRLWCGHKRYTAWLADEMELWRIAIREGLAYEDRDGNAGLGPLTWIEVGERKYARSRTVTIMRRGYPYPPPASRLDELAAFALAGLFYAALLGWPLVEAIR